MSLSELSLCHISEFVFRSQGISSTFPRPLHIRVHLSLTNSAIITSCFRKLGTMALLKADDAKLLKFCDTRTTFIVSLLSI